MNPQEPKDVVFYTKFDFSDLYLMCILEQRSESDGDYWKNGIIENTATTSNTYVYFLGSKVVIWCSSIDTVLKECERIGIKPVMISIVDFLWEII